jgi:hypothetical protein
VKVVVRCFIEAPLKRHSRIVRRPGRTCKHVRAPPSLFSVLGGRQFFVLIRQGHLVLTVLYQFDKGLGEGGPGLNALIRARREETGKPIQQATHWGELGGFGHLYQPECNFGMKSG